ncbi:hypothetical protein PCE1_000968 [Barthelona sp. PCE]
MKSRQISFFLNGLKYEVNHTIDPLMSVSSYFREVMGIKSVKVACSEGGCGACTVLVASMTTTGDLRYRALLGCMTPIYYLHNSAVWTAAGLGSVSTELHIIQKRVAEFHGTQCGFCTPGIVMAIVSFLLETKQELGGRLPSMAEIEESFDCNLCRCTGYRPILDAAKSFAHDCSDDIKKRCNEDLPTNFLNLNVPNLRIPTSISFNYSNVDIYVPTTLQDLIAIVNEMDSCPKFISGLSEIKIEQLLFDSEFPSCISLHLMSDYAGIDVEGEAITIGAMTPLLHIQKFVKTVEKIPELRPLFTLAHQLTFFANRMIRSVATLAGNVVNSAPIADAIPVLMAVNAEYVIVNAKEGSSRRVRADSFVKGYKKVDLEEFEFVSKVIIPKVDEFTFTHAMKQCRRLEDDISIINGGFLIRIVDGIIAELRLSFGGMAPWVVMANKTMTEMNGKPFDIDTVHSLVESVRAELPLSDNAPGGIIPYRRTMLQSIIVQFISYVCTERGNRHMLDELNLDPYEPIEHTMSRGEQHYKDEKSTTDAGTDKMHLAGYLHATGEAEYSVDVEAPHMLHVAVVKTTKPHARIISADYSDVWDVEGVVSVITADDIPGKNATGAISKDEEYLVTNECLYYGQPIALVVATTNKVAWLAAKKAKIEYEELDAVVTIEDAIAKECYFDFERYISNDDHSLETVMTELEGCDVVVEGEVKTPEQEHFYMENNNAVVVPGEEYQLYYSTQSPSGAQSSVSRILGIDSNRVIAKVRRCGGAFGGKECNYLWCGLAALAAHKTNRPCRFNLGRQDDMLLTGKRQPYLIKYKAGFKADGTCHALHTTIYADAGFSWDLSVAMIERSMFHIDAGFKWPYLYVNGKICQTNKPSMTAFRGFGLPAAHNAGEVIVRHGAIVLKKELFAMKRANLMGEAAKTHFGMILNDNHLLHTFDEVVTLADLRRRQEEVAAFNATHKRVKRGLSHMTMKFGISFTNKMMNKASALVHCYQDGSVFISHGGIEMGQGVHTKVAQIASEVLGVPLEKVHVTETATDKVANTSPTAASTGADLNCAAVKNACEEINANLIPIREKYPDAEFSVLCLQAFLNRVPTSAYGYYATPINGWDWETKTGHPFNYFTYGSAVSEVEVDTLTGYFKILRTDICMDLGRSINPSIDIGQIEGAFVQGTGWNTIEEVLRMPNGAVFGPGPAYYKIPSYTDIPRDMRIYMLDMPVNDRAVRGSKGVGEPPFVLGYSIYEAIVSAVNSFRTSVDLDEVPQIGFPASCDRIRMACEDEYTRVAYEQ